MASGLELVGKSAFGTVTSYLKTLMDPEKRRLLDEQTMQHVLAELPRIVRLIEERCADLEARGCTHYEANVIANQVIEAQKRTLDEDKRARLTNVLVNGFVEEAWDKATHRLMVRLVIDLEEEHIARLRDYAEWRKNPEEYLGRLNALQAPRPEESANQLQQRLTRQAAVAQALDRELTMVGLLNENDSISAYGAGGPELNSAKSISDLGATFLAHLRDPEVLEHAPSAASPDGARPMVPR